MATILMATSFRTNAVVVIRVYSIVVYICVCVSVFLGFLVIHKKLYHVEKSPLHSATKRGSHCEKMPYLKLMLLCHLAYKVYFSFGFHR